MCFLTIEKLSWTHYVVDATHLPKSQKQMICLKKEQKKPLPKELMSFSRHTSMEA
jgi:hypothetical protein